MGYHVGFDYTVGVRFCSNQHCCLKFGLVLYYSLVFPKLLNEDTSLKFEEALIHIPEAHAANLGKAFYQFLPTMILHTADTSPVYAIVVFSFHPKGPFSIPNPTLHT